MAEKDVAAVRRLWEAWERNDLDGMLETLSDEVETHRVPMDTASVRGKEGYLDLIADWGEQFAEWSATAEEYIDAGERVIVRTRYEGMGEASGASVTAEYWFVYTVDDGKIVRQEYFDSESDALKAARPSRSQR